MVTQCPNCPMFNANTLTCQNRDAVEVIVTKPNAQDPTPGLPDRCPLRMRSIMIGVQPELRTQF